MRRFLSWLAMILGVVTTLIGVVFAAMYVFEAVIKRIGDPDQSLVFWYLPILLLGVFCIVIGIRLLDWGVNRLRAAYSTEEQGNAQQ